MKQTQRTDYRDYDYLDVYIKKKHAEDLERAYAAFKWEMLTKKERSGSDGIVLYTFRRPHKMENKDELQFLQVNAEFEMNAINSVWHNKHCRSALLGSVCAISGCAAIAGGIVLSLVLRTVLFTVCGCLLAAAGLAACIAGAIAVPRLYRAENARFLSKLDKRHKTLTAIMQKAQLLTENADGTDGKH